MTITKETVSQLLGENDLSEDVIVNLKLMVESTIAEQVSTQIEEKTNILKANLEALTEENVKLKSAAESYAEYVKETYEAKLAEIEESSEAYGEYAKNECEAKIAKIEEAAEAYGEYAKDECEAKIAKIEEAAEAYGKYVVEELSNKVDTYLDYVVEQFVKENEEAIVESVDYKKMKTVFNEMKNSFAKHLYRIDSNTAVNDVQAKLDESLAEHNKVLSELSQAKKKATELNRALVFEQLTKTLADTQKDKVAALVEKVRFNSEAEYARGVQLMIEEISVSKPVNLITESTVNKQTIQEAVKTDLNLLGTQTPTPVPSSANIEDVMASYLKCLK